MDFFENILLKYFLKYRYSFVVSYFHIHVLLNCLDLTLIGLFCYFVMWRLKFLFFFITFLLQLHYFFFSLKWKYIYNFFNVPSYRRKCGKNRKWKFFFCSWFRFFFFIFFNSCLVYSCRFLEFYLFTFL